MSRTPNATSPLNQLGLFTNEKALQTIRPDAAIAFAELAVSIVEVESLTLNIEAIRKCREKLRNEFLEETIRQTIDRKDDAIAWYNSHTAKSMPTKQDAAIRGMGNAAQIYSMPNQEFDCFEGMLRQQLALKINFMSNETKAQPLSTNFLNIVVSWATLKHATTRRIKITEARSDQSQHNLAAYENALRAAFPRETIVLNRQKNKILIRNPSLYASHALLPSG